MLRLRLDSVAATWLVYALAVLHLHALLLFGAALIIQLPVLLLDTQLLFTPESLTLMLVHAAVGFVVAVVIIMFISNAAAMGSVVAVAGIMAVINNHTAGKGDDGRGK